MTCDPLAYTGSGVQLGPVLIVALALLFTGGLLLLLSRRRGRAVTATLLLLVSGAALAITAGTPTQALADDCPPPDNSAAEGYRPGGYPAENSLTIVQTSVLNGLAPGIGPVAITGVVSNNGTDSTEITAIDVEIVRVTTDPGSAPGACGPSDYLLLNSRMPVGRTLGPRT
ncbi:MAG: hypothetical protein ABJD68_19525, partial [Nakamurella sp.]